MELFGTSHGVVLAVFVAGLAPAVLAGRRPPADVVRRGGRVAGVLLGAAGVGATLLDLLTRYDVDVSLPLQLSDLAWMSASLALVTRHRLAVACTYFWGLTLTLQAVVTPSLAESYPDVRFFAFWVLHLGTIWAAVHLTWGVGLVPSWRDYRDAVGVTLTWLVAVLAFNLAADTNYGYLVRKPSKGSALDPLGPWPVYLLAEVAILGSVWALMTWPWQRRAGRRSRPAGASA